MNTTETIFLAGASRAIGMRLVPLLVRTGYRAIGTTRSTDLGRDASFRLTLSSVAVA